MEVLESHKTAIMSLEELCLQSWLVMANKSIVGLKQEFLLNVQESLSNVLKSSLGGLSSINIRSKMFDTLVDVRFLSKLASIHFQAPSAVNNVRQHVE